MALALPVPPNLRISTLLLPDAEMSTPRGVRRLPHDGSYSVIGANGSLEYRAEIPINWKRAAAAFVVVAIAAGCAAAAALSTRRGGAGGLQGTGNPVRTLRLEGRDPCSLRGLGSGGDGAVATDGDSSPCAPPQKIGRHGWGSHCAGFGEDCTASRCCSKPGMQCFAKNNSHALCRAECAEGRDPTDPDPNPWSCVKLGARAPGRTLQCAAPGEDCRAAGHCCTEVGARCFAKNATWAECRQSCKSGPHLEGADWHPWSCEVLGPPAAGVALWVQEKCAKPAEDCSKASCCTEPGAQCYKKNGYWAECKANCSHPWSCERLGARTPAAPPREQQQKVWSLASWVGDHCAEMGSDCRDSRCCRTTGTQCFEKNSDWASCRASCEPGPDFADLDGNPWICRALGPRTPSQAVHVAADCSGDLDDCSKSQCCKTPGMQCYAKDKFWAQCRASCDPSRAEDGLCTELGPRTPAALALPQAPQQHASDVLPPWLALRCAEAEENCKVAMCCMERGMQCYEKNATHGSCRADCAPGPDAADGGDDWSCRKLGPRSPTSTITATSTTTTTTTSTTTWTSTSTWTTSVTLSTTTHTTTAITTFCFSVVRNTGYEPRIMKAQLAHRAGIFACDDFALLSTGPLSLGNGVEAIQFEPATVGVSSDGTAGNTKLFRNAWAAIGRDGRYKRYDWTLKVDPDAVLMPQRLHHHFVAHNGQKAFFKNCGHWAEPALYGSLEAFSREALQSYFWDIMGPGAQNQCMRWEWEPWGEDRFMAYCLIHLGVEPVNDFKIVLDDRCEDPYDKEPGLAKEVRCDDGSAAAFHPFKTEEDWLNCWRSAASVDADRAAAKEAREEAENRRREEERERIEAVVEERRQVILESQHRWEAKLHEEVEARQAARAAVEKLHAKRKALEAERRREKEDAASKAAAAAEAQRREQQGQRQVEKMLDDPPGESEKEAARQEAEPHKRRQRQPGGVAQPPPPPPPWSLPTQAASMPAPTPAPAPAPTPPAAPDHAEGLEGKKRAALQEILKVGDKVRVRDKASTRWLVGNVTHLDPFAVRPLGWRSGFPWKIMDVIPVDGLAVGEKVRRAFGAPEEGVLKGPDDIGEVMKTRPSVASPSEYSILVRRRTSGAESWYRESSLVRERPAAGCAARGCGLVWGLGANAPASQDADVSGEPVDTHACDCHNTCVHTGNCCIDFVETCLLDVIG